MKYLVFYAVDMLLWSAALVAAHQRAQALPGPDLLEAGFGAVPGGGI